MITIIGAGPVGSYSAYLLAKKGFDVKVFEEHKVIGKPVQCAGIVSSEFSKVIGLDDKFILNKLNKVKVVSKHKSIILDIEDYVIDREKFDKEIAKKAKKAGAKFYLNKKYLGISNNNVVFADKKNKFIKVKTDKLIGADGPLSDVAKSNSMFSKRKFYVGMQARVRGKFDADTYEVYLGSICPGFFAWVVPESKNIARIGVACKKEVFQSFSEFLEIKNIKKKNIISKQAGLIPIWNKGIIIQENEIYLIGDAAAQVKATTGGGLVPGLKAAKLLVDCIANNKDYKKESRKINKELSTHLKIRKILDVFSNKDYDELIKILHNKRVKRVLKYYNRDMAAILAFKLILAEPKFLRYLVRI